MFGELAGWPVRKHLAQNVDFWETGGILGPSESIKGRAAVRIKNDFSQGQAQEQGGVFSLLFITLSFPAIEL